MWAKWYVRLAFFTLGTLFVGSICYSRLFLGVHSLNQLLYGVSMGMWFACCAHFFWKEPLDKLVKSLINGEETGLMKLGLYAFGLVTCFTVIDIIIYNVALGFENPASWS